MGSPTKRIQYRYDSRGNRQSMIDPDGGRFTYSYDARNRIQHLVNPQGERTTYSYDSRNRRTETRLANGTRTSYSYDAVSNLQRLSNLKSNGSVISDFQYSYDRTGNRTSVLEGDGRRVTWSYDAASQLICEHRPAESWNDLSLDDWDTLSPEGWGALSVDSSLRSTYTYDPAGNRTLKNEGGARTTYSYDLANQLKWSQDASGRTTYTFDADGNQQRVLAPDGSRTTTVWDYENRTTSIQLPSGIRNTMAYEPEGLRVKLEESTGTKKFVWDDQNYLAETDGSNDMQVVYTNEPRYYGNLISQRRGSTTSWYHFDALGSTRQLTDVAQAITDQRLYDAWGKVVGSSGSMIFPFQFVGGMGYYTDPGQNTIYVRARIYDPTMARWRSIDPLILGAATTGDSFLYAANNGVTLVDGSGLNPRRRIITPWDAKDFISHYYLGGGATVDLHDTGLFEHWRYSVRKSIGGILNNLKWSRPDWYMRGEECRPESWEKRHQGSAAVDLEHSAEWKWDGLFETLKIINSSSLSWKADCTYTPICGRCACPGVVLAWDIECTVFFHMSDKFANPGDRKADHYQFGEEEKRKLESCYDICRAFTRTYWELWMCKRNCNKLYPPSEYVGGTPYPISATWSESMSVHQPTDACPGGE